jgi:hypothetical protein
MVDDLKLAQEFHDLYEKLAPSFGYETRTDTKAFDPLSRNGRLMMAVCANIGNKLEKSAFDAGFQAGLREAR